MKTKKVFLFVPLIISIFFSVSLAKDDKIKEECTDHPRGPWCYEEKVVELLDADLCSNITKYWGKNANGVEGYCFYEIALKTKDCTLCDRITKADIRNNLCLRDVCKKKSKKKPSNKKSDKP